MEQLQARRSSPDQESARSTLMDAPPAPERGLPSRYMRPRLQPPKRKTMLRGKAARRGLPHACRYKYKFF
jgi:hypothetical protein